MFSGKFDCGSGTSLQDGILLSNQNCHFNDFFKLIYLLKKIIIIKFVNFCVCLSSSLRRMLKT